jgi:hypothetical protein
MSWTFEVLVRERQRDLLEAAERRRLVAEARRERGGTHLLVSLRSALAHLWAAARLRRRLA